MLLINEVIPYLIAEIDKIMATRSANDRYTPEYNLAKLLEIQGIAEEKAPSIPQSLHLDDQNLPNLAAVIAMYKHVKDRPDEIDDKVLLMNKTWRELMLTTQAEYETVLRSNLKEQSYTKNKMLILSRFKRQLIVLKDIATKLLETRQERVFTLKEPPPAIESPVTALVPSAQSLSVMQSVMPANKNKKNKGEIKAEPTVVKEELKADAKEAMEPKLEVNIKPQLAASALPGIDEWLVDRVKECHKEANTLIDVASKLAEVEINFYFKKPHFNRHGPGETEVIMKTCVNVMEAFVAFCKQEDQENKRPAHHPDAMKDLLPRFVDPKYISKLAIANEESARWLVQNLFTVGATQAYTELQLKIPYEIAKYDLKKAEHKRAQLLAMLHVFSERTDNLDQDSELFWSNLFGCLDTQLSFSYRSSSKGEDDAQLREELHRRLFNVVPPKLTHIKTAHANCRFKGP